MIVIVNDDHPTQKKVEKWAMKPNNQIGDNKKITFSLEDIMRGKTSARGRFIVPEWLWDKLIVCIYNYALNLWRKRLFFHCIIILSNDNRSTGRLVCIKCISACLLFWPSKLKLSQTMLQQISAKLKNKLQANYHVLLWISMSICNSSRFHSLSAILTSCRRIMLILHPAHAANTALRHMPQKLLSGYCRKVQNIFVLLHCGDMSMDNARVQ